MQYRSLGRTGIKVSPYCLGAMMFGKMGNPDHDESICIIHKALDAGINFIDTADRYSAGESEEIIGKALKGRRDSIVLATKFHGPMGEDPNMQGNSRRWITRAVEDSLRRLDIAAVAGDYAAWNYFQSIDLPENAAFLKAFHTKYGPQRHVTDPMEAAYVGVKLWAQAAREANATDPHSVRTAMRNQRMQAPEGTVRVDAGSQHLYKTPRIGQIGDNGEFAVVWAADAPVAPEPYPATRKAEEWRAFLRDLQRGWNGQWAAP